jgi:hemin uptake protein HemP
MIKIDSVFSLQNREQRAEVIRLANSFHLLAAPIQLDTIKRLFVFENKLHSVIQNDKKWFFTNAGDIDTETFARDLGTLHGVAAKTLVLLIGRREEWSYSVALKQDALEQPSNASVQDALAAEVDDKSNLRDLIAFAMYHFGALIKWSFFRREPIKNTIWPQLHKLYQFAESEGLTTEHTTLFSSENAYITTIASLYIRALMLDLLNTGSLNMPQIEIADGWLAAWTPQYQLTQETASKSYALLVNLDATAGLQLAAKVQKTSSTRHLIIDALKVQMDQARESLRLGQPYNGRGLPNLFSMEEHVALLTKVERLYATMLDAAAKGVEARKAVQNKGVAVLLGVENVTLALNHEVTSSHAPSGMSSTQSESNSFTLSLEPMGHEIEASADTIDYTIENPSWTLTDISPSGMGFAVSNSNAKLLEVGSLIAIKIFDAGKPSERWILASVARRVEQTEPLSTLLGTEILSLQPVGVRLQRIEMTTDDAATNKIRPVADARNALFIPGEDSRGRSDKLLIPFDEIGVDKQDATYQLKTTSATFVVKLNRAIRKGADWLMFGFEVINKIE